MCAFGIANLQFESNLSEYFRKGNEVSKEVEAFEERYGGSSYLLKVVDSNQPGGVLTPAFIDTLNDLESSLEGFNILSKTSTFANLIESFYSGLPTQVQPNLLRGMIAGTVIQGSVSQDSSRAAIHTYIRNTNARDISQTLVRVENGLREILPAEFTVTLKCTPRIIQLHMESSPEARRSVSHSRFWSYGRLYRSCFLLSWWDQWSCYPFLCRYVQSGDHGYSRGLA